MPKTPNRPNANSFQATAFAKKVPCLVGSDFLRRFAVGCVLLGLVLLPGCQSVQDLIYGETTAEEDYNFPWDGEISSETEESETTEPDSQSDTPGKEETVTPIDPEKDSRLQIEQKKKS